MRLQQIIQAEQTLARTLSAIQKMGIGPDVARDMFLVQQLFQELRHAAVCLDEIRRGEMAEGVREQVVSRLLSFIQEE